VLDLERDPSTNRKGRETTPGVRVLAIRSVRLCFEVIFSGKQGCHGLGGVDTTVRLRTLQIPGHVRTVCRKRLELVAIEPSASEDQVAGFIANIDELTGLVK
jgi:hypothetical protein